jgi:hypothetical protein
MPKVPKNSGLNNIIAPEISGDRFHASISWLSEHEELRTVLEIGSSAGGGSTTAFVEGLSRNPGRPTLYCMELSIPRFEKLRRTYSECDFVSCYNVSSVALERFPSEQDVAEFYNSQVSVLNQWPLEQVIGWLRQDIEYVASSGVPQNGIQRIKAENKIRYFDMVLIDGSEFTGNAELEEVHGAKIICLDDTRTYKNYRSRQRLMNDASYQLIVEDDSLRNGFSVFCRRDAPCAWRDRGIYLDDRGCPSCKGDGAPDAALLRA